MNKETYTLDEVMKAFEFWRLVPRSRPRKDAVPYVDNRDAKEVRMTIYRDMYHSCFGHVAPRSKRAVVEELVSLLNHIKAHKR